MTSSKRLAENPFFRLLNIWPVSLVGYRYSHKFLPIDLALLTVSLAAT